MPVRFNHTFLRFRRLLLLSFLLLVFSADLFALPIKTSILNPEKQVVGQAPGLHWLCGITETGQHSSGTAGVRQYFGRIPDVCGTRWQKTEPSWKRKKSPD